MRVLKAKDLKSFVSCASGGVDDGAKSIVEGAFVGNFDPDYYRSDRKTQKIEELVIVSAEGREPAIA